MARGEGIKHITNLFDSYRTRLIAPKRTIIEAFIEVVSDLYGFTVGAEEIAYTPATRTLSLRSPGPLKTEVLLRKEEILAHLTGRLGQKNAPKDIV